MKLIKYKVTNSFNGHQKNDIIDAYLLGYDTTDGVGLCCHFQENNDKLSCNSVEFIIQQDDGIWIPACDYSYTWINLSEQYFEFRITKQ